MSRHEWKQFRRAERVRSVRQIRATFDPAELERLKDRLQRQERAQ